MTSTKLELKTYYLRKLTKDDVDDKYLSWLKDKEVTKYLEIRHENYNLKDLQTYVESCNKDHSKYLFGIFSKDKNEHIGNTTIYDINHRNKTFDIGYLIGDKRHWGTSASVETLLLSLKFAFDDLKLRKMFGGVYSNHLSSRFTLKRSGFIEEARLKKRFFFNDKFVDEVIYTMDREKWVEIKKKFLIG